MNFDIIVPHKKSPYSIDENVVKVIFSQNNKVIYFSRGKLLILLEIKETFIII